MDLQTMLELYLHLSSDSNVLLIGRVITLSVHGGHAIMFVTTSFVSLDLKRC